MRSKDPCTLRIINLWGFKSTKSHKLYIVVFSVLKLSYKDMISKIQYTCLSTRICWEKELYLFIKLKQKYHDYMTGNIR